MTLGLFGREREDVSTTPKRGTSQWKIASISDNAEKKVRKKTVFSFWSATKYVMILSLLLWWLPVFGQMIAGYIGGRKAGSPWRGVAAAILPVIAIFSVMTAIDHFFPQYVTESGSASASLLSGFVTAVPFVGPYLDFTREYVGQFLASLQGSSPYEMNSYVLTIAFAYVGGIIGDQTRREIDSASGKAGSHTTFMVAQPPSNEPTSYPYRQPYVHPSAYTQAGWGFLPHFGFLRRPAVVRTFEEMVPEDAEAEGRRDARSKKRSVKKRVLRKERAKSSQYNPRHQKHMQQRMISPNPPRGHPHKQHGHQQMKVSASRPRTLMKAEKMIEKEWDPKRRESRSPWIARRESSKKKPKTRSSRNWESF